MRVLGVVVDVVDVVIVVDGGDGGDGGGVNGGGGGCCSAPSLVPEALLLIACTSLSIQPSAAQNNKLYALLYRLLTPETPFAEKACAKRRFVRPRHENRRGGGPLQTGNKVRILPLCF